MISIDYKSRQPIYEQLVSRIRTLALGGVLAPGEKLPSVRQLSAELGVNPNTVQRAYNTLVQQGVILSAPGKGNYITDDADTLRRAGQTDALTALRSTLTEAKAAGVRAAQAKEALQEVYSEEGSL